MLQFIFCLFGLHGVTEIDYMADDEEIKVCRNCLKEVKQDHSSKELFHKAVIFKQYSCSAKEERRCDASQACLIGERVKQAFFILKIRRTYYGNQSPSHSRC